MADKKKKTNWRFEFKKANLTCQHESQQTPRMKHIFIEIYSLKKKLKYAVPISAKDYMKFGDKKNWEKSSLMIYGSPFPWEFQLWIVDSGIHSEVCRSFLLLSSETPAALVCSNLCLLMIPINEGMPRQLLTDDSVIHISSTNLNFIIIIFNFNKKGKLYIYIYRSLLILQIKFYVWEMKHIFFFCKNKKSLGVA